MSFKNRKKLLGLSFWFSRAWLSGLAILVFSIDVGTNIYTNFQASDENFAKERDEKIAAIEQSPEALRRRKKGDTISDLSLTNSQLMVDNNKVALDQIKNGEREQGKVKLWDNGINKSVNNAANSDTAYTNYVREKSQLVIDDYNRKIERKKLSSLTGGATGLAVGLLSPVFSLFLMSMSTKPYDSNFKNRCIAGGYGAQFLSSCVTYVAILQMFGSQFIAICFGLVLFWCAPLLYESVARERQRKIAERADRLKLELEEEEKLIEIVRKEKAIQDEEATKRKRQENKAGSEQSRMKNLIATAKQLANPENNPVPEGVPKTPEGAAIWFVESGEPYGLQIKLAEYCGATRSSFNRLVEQKRLTIGDKLPKNGKAEVAGH